MQIRRRKGDEVEASSLRDTLPGGKWLAVFGVLIGVGLLVLWFYRHNQGPAVGVIHTPAVYEPQVESATTATFRGVKIAFDYPSGYATVENKGTPAPPVIELYSLNQTSPSSGSKSIGITVKNTSGGVMLEDSAFKFRSIKPADYEISDTEVAGQSAKKSVKKDGTEITYFVPGPDAYTIIAATTSNPDDPAFAEELSKLVQSFVWR